MFINSSFCLIIHKLYLISLFKKHCTFKTKRRKEKMNQSPDITANLTKILFFINVK